MEDFNFALTGTKIVAPAPANEGTKAPPSFDETIEMISSGTLPEPVPVVERGIHKFPERNRVDVPKSVQARRAPALPENPSL